MKLPTTNGACSQPEYIITVSYSESELPTDLSISYTRTEYECIIRDILLYDFAPRRSRTVYYYYYYYYEYYYARITVVHRKAHYRIRVLASHIRTSRFR